MKRYLLGIFNLPSVCKSGDTPDESQNVQQEEKNHSTKHNIKVGYDYKRKIYSLGIHKEKNLGDLCENFNLPANTTGKSFEAHLAPIRICQ